MGPKKRRSVKGKENSTGNTQCFFSHLQIFSQTHHQGKKIKEKRH